MNTLWLVLARSGSRSIPDKNVAPLGGHPLLAWRIAAARKLSDGRDVWISTDSPRYAELAERYGARVPFLRPAELAADETPSSAVVLHALEHGDGYDAVAVLEPTSPFVLPETLQAAHNRLACTPEAQAIVATRLCRPSTFYIQPESEYLDELAARLGSGAPPRRQEEAPEVTPSGGFYIARTAGFRQRPSFYTERTLGHRVSEFEALEIDEPIDLEWAAFLVQSGRATPESFGL